MSFWGFIALLLLTCIMVGALYMAKKATNKELELQKRRNRIREIRSELADIDELLQTLLLYDRDVNLLYNLVNRMEKDISEGLTLIPNSPDLLEEKESLLKIRPKIIALTEEPLEPEIPGTDRQIFLVKRHFSQTLKLIRDFYQKGDIDEISFNQHRNRLLLNSIMLEFNAYVRQAEEAKALNNLGMAANFYKHAKDILHKSDVDIPNKNNEIKRISKEISGLYVTHADEEMTKDK
ncbi:hypothetical protein [Reinekea sp.]|uniref:hypothetical protein n=3 Tax=Reinekea sp. TaxID=1970455 RepID=UPI003989E453